MFKEKGFVLLLTLVLMVTLSALAGSLILSLTTNFRNASFQTNDAKAFWLGEAGISDVIKRLKNNELTIANGATDSTSMQNIAFGSGTYSVTIARNGTTYTLTSTGTVDSQSRQVVQSVVVGTGASPAFSYVQHSERNLNFNNSTGTVTGNVSVGNNLQNSGGITFVGTVTQDSAVATPTVNTASYQAIANTVVTVTKTFTAGTYSGIWYVTGNVTIQSNVTINGTVISSGGHITFANNATNITVTPSTGYPALVAAASNKDVVGTRNSSLSISGLIYAGRDISFNRNSGTFAGTMIAGRDILLRNLIPLNVTYASEILTSPPPYFSGGGGTTVTKNKDWNEI
ncbi:MAG: hypothetical protein A3C35_03180 [Omnitrophica bacterium RIFCSPHIGHO2_02_FULL_46_11]|nr:MAG: hypothetical protein A3C35_03180 [Omnitrophica bacterium RIFCSPHIGHO2_02_FULL_46_11]